MTGPGSRRWWRTRSVDDLGLLGESILVVVVTWLLLGSIFDRAITQADGTVQWVPYLRSSLAAGFDWTDHLYRFGVIGGSAMHDSAGTLPLVQLCAGLGLGATTTANVLTIFLQVSIGFFSLLLVRGLVGAWHGSPFRLGRVQRICVIWACAFAPWLGWRLAYGHENLVLGLLPLIACAGLIGSARSEIPSPVALLYATFVVWNGLSGLGAQMVVYGLVFGGPAVVVLALEGRTAPRLGRPQAAIAAALLAGVLITLPRLAGMIAHAGGDDFARSGSLTYSYGIAGWSDWLGSLPWTAFGAAEPHAIPIHDSNLPIGPLVLLIPLLWPANAPRRLAWTLAISGLVAILFASNVPPFGDLLLRAIPPLDMFRVPSRALIVILVFLPPLALAACYARLPHPGSTRLEGLWLLVGVAVIAGGRFAPGGVREIVAIATTIVVVVLVRRRPQLAVRAHLASGVVALAALGVCAFHERFPQQLPTDRIEDGPRALHDRLVAEVPELAMPLTRIQLIDPPRPYAMSTAFAAGLASLDGAWYPTRRFLTLLSTLTGKPFASTAGVFQLTRSRAFPVLQQLYNVRYAFAYEGGRNVLHTLPSTPGGAWFPARVDVIETAGEMAVALAGGARPGDVAWLLRGDRTPAPNGCSGASVQRISVDALGQRATFVVDSPATCTMVVATNFVESLRATSAATELAVFPIDLALTGIDVPAGHAEITLEPTADLPLWSRIASFVGAALAISAIVLGRSRQPVT